MAEPFNLVVGDSVDLMIKATNQYGSSEYSTIGGGALIQYGPDSPSQLLNLPEVTSANQIGITWTDGKSDGGASVIDYRIQYDQSTGTWIELASGIQVKYYTTTVSLIQGHLYSFKVKARNSVGYSDFSSPVSILAAQIPDVPLAPTTIISDRWNVVINWVAPYNGGTPITSYTIEIRTKDSSIYFIDSLDCNGSNSLIVAEKKCTVKVATLRVSPFLIPWGQGVYARIIATNYLGSSAASDTGNGAVLLTFPDEPINLSNNSWFLLLSMQR